ncbi:MAG TPA: thioredoxin domain-containing protein [Acidobacteriota bacterium]|nr:thioredoxin domain-containing protein [Acidobacteriota bacterium]HQM63359.1 thioredoxin domain-containing protein [Acidobacteriota bacterium]
MRSGPEPGSQSVHTNRLIYERSPYLLQHAHNPVDWHPWGAAAFEAARQAGKPVFLSVGYATCHWCHVMERESFDDPEVARLINETFIPVKVDREERPDVDHVYMAVCQAMTGRGGWPLTALLTAEGEPFFVGTYFPKHSRPGLPGLIELIPRFRSLWQERRGELVRNAVEIAAAIREEMEPATSNEAWHPRVHSQAYTQLRASFDPSAGGFGSAPKFPTPHKIMFLLRYWRRTGETMALEMVRQTLRHMRRGGVYDQIGFGFHRYSTDAMWRLPHFEKMLYDQALMAAAYIEAYQAVGDPEFRTTAEEIFEYVIRDMRDPGGAFYSAEDADSEGVEGKFYLWQIDELRRIMSPGEAEPVIAWFNLAESGNFTDPHQHTPDGSNVLYLSNGAPIPADAPGPDRSPQPPTWKRIRSILLDARNRRERPLRDDKILTDWNGLMVGALAMGARVLNRPDLAESAIQALDFILSRMSRADGRLFHRHRDGESGIDGQLDDYAFLVHGLLETYQATGLTRYLAQAIRLTDQALELFWDPNPGGCFMTPLDGERLLFRAKETYDGATPSGNSVSLENLYCLAALTSRADYTEIADRLLRGLAGSVAGAPSAHARCLGALSAAPGEETVIILSGRREDEAFQQMRRISRQGYRPGTVWLWLTEDAEGEAIRALIPHLDHLPAGGAPAAIICRNRACQPPLNGPDELARFLETS